MNGPIVDLEQKSLTVKERLKALNGPLLAWYREHARILPWREEPEAYKVWISEIMLQQTRVEAVKPYYQRFVEELPDIQALAQAEEVRLLKLWEGLGYYNRVRNLKKAAQIVVKDFDGRLPASCQELQMLPGIGCYTAGAIASIAYGIPVPAVDGNVLRVLSRVLASREDILKQSVKRQLEKALEITMPTNQPGAFNQGLMEIGAVICVPNGRPRCEECPLALHCLTKKQKLWAEVPYKAPKKKRRIEEKTILLIESEGRIAIRKRPGQGLLASMYEFPSFEGTLTREEAALRLAQACGNGTDLWAAEEKAQIQEAGTAKHIFSHVEWHMTGYRLRSKKAPEGCIFVEKQSLKKKYPLPNAFRVYTKQIIGES